PDPSAPSSAIADTIEALTIQGIRAGVRERIPGRVAYVTAATEAGFEASLGRQAARSGLVIVGATTDLSAVAKVAKRYPKTRFALLSASINDADFPHANVTGIVFDDGEVGYLAGYLGALESGRAGRISAVAGIPTPSVKRIVAGFRAGARRARPGVAVTVG